VLNLPEYPPRLTLARTPTPFHYLTRASDQWGGGKRLWIKRDDLTGSALTGNKVRKLEFFAAHALNNGFRTLVTCGGLQSNHCRATALVAAQLGLRCHLVLRADDSDRANTGNFLIDQIAGATYEVLPAVGWNRALQSAYERLEQAYLDAAEPALMIPTGGSDSLGIWGYIAAAEELARDIATHNIDRAAVVLATGSAGTQTGLTAGVALAGLPLEVVGYAVCDDARWFNAKVREDWQAARRRWPQLPAVRVEPVTQDHSAGPAYGIAPPEVYQLIVDLARLEGVVLDPVYTGKAFLGLLRDIREGFFDGVDDIIFVHTGGIFGLFAHEHSLIQAAS
jgi:D-cysteine desulfhydrase